MNCRHVILNRVTLVDGDAYECQECHVFLNVPEEKKIEIFFGTQNEGDAL